MLRLLQVLFGAFAAFARWYERRQVEAAGRAKERAENAEKTLERIKQAERINSNAGRLSDHWLHGRKK